MILNLYCLPLKNLNFYERESFKTLKKIKVKDNREPLVGLKKFCPEIIIGLEKRRLKKEKSIFVRKTAVQMLKKAQRFLPRGYKFKVFDGWRPLKEQSPLKGQKRYCFKVFKKLEKENPQWPLSRLKREVNKWVVSPSIKVPSWHTTGGATDLTICYPNGKSLPMKSKKEKLPNRVLKNRKLLKEIMEKVGFANYKFEWWHFSYGDTGWALRKNKKWLFMGLLKKSNKNVLLSALVVEEIQRIG